MGVRDRFKKRKKEKESAPEKATEPLPEEIEELAPESSTQEAEETTPTPVAEETEKLAPETSAERTKEPTPEPMEEETKELSPEPIAEKAEKPTSEPIAEETEEITPETPTEKTEKPTLGPRKFGFRDWFKRRKQKKKESSPEPEKLMEPVPEEAEELTPEPPTQEAKEPTPEPIAEETKVASEPPTQGPEPTPELAVEEAELAPEPPSEKMEKPIPERRKFGFRNWFKRRRQRKEKEKERIPEPEKPREPSIEEAGELAPATSALETEVTTPEPVAEEKEEIALELPTQEIEEPTPEPMEEETKELSPEPIAEKAEKPTPQPRRPGRLGWFKRRGQKKKEMMEKVRELRAKLQISEVELAEVTSCLPISSGPFEVKMLMVKNKLNDVVGKTSARLSDTSEINEIFNELDNLSHEIDNLAIEYQVFVNCEFAKLFGMFKDIGLETEVTVKTAFEKEAPLEERINQIKDVLEVGRSLANDVINVAEQVYEVLRSFYNPALPEESPSIAFARKKLDEKAPWIALNVLFVSLTNWNKQYKVQISQSIADLPNSLASIANLNTKNDRLLPFLGDNFPIIMENAKKAENIKIDFEKKVFDVIIVLTIRDVFHSSLNVVRDVLSILYEKLKSKEKAIEILAPSVDFLWEKNVDLMKRMASAMEITSKSSEFTLGQVLESLPKFLSYVDECIKTIALYSEIEEFLLNYPIAEMAVEDLFRQKKYISAKDLPFVPKYAEEYLKLFYSQRYREFSLDKTNMLLTKKT
jgi:hypothetical protein